MSEETLSHQEINRLLGIKNEPRVEDWLLELEGIRRKKGAANNQDAFIGGNLTDYRNATDMIKGGLPQGDTECSREEPRWLS